MMSEKVISLNAWRSRLQENGRGGSKKNVTNLMLYLSGLKEFGKNIRWNELAHRVEWNGLPLDPSDLIEMRLIMEQQTPSFEPPVSDLLDTIIHYSKVNSYHPIRDYLDGLKWDGVKRIDRWMQVCLGSPDTPFNRIVGRKTLVAACARAHKPGCKVDTVLVLEGPQGIKKSSAIEALFGEDFTAESVNLFDQHNKMVMSMMGAWVVELAEFIAIAKRDQNTVKGMLSMRSDRVVLPYAKIASDHPRQCVFFGTINPGESGYLTDTTGNRRYWPVEVAKADLGAIIKCRDQMWAEANAAYKAGEIWWLESDEENSLAQAQVTQREEYDVWDEILEAKLYGVETTTAGAALQAIGVPNERMDKRALNRIGSCLRRLGFKQSGVSKVTDGDGSRKSVRIFTREGQN